MKLLINIFLLLVSRGYGSDTRMNQRYNQLSSVAPTVILVGLIGTFFLGCVTHTDRVDSNKLARLYMEEIAAALDHFKSDVGRYPSSEENLKALLEKPANAPGWKGPYLVYFPKDPWG